MTTAAHSRPEQILQQLQQAAQHRQRLLQHDRGMLAEVLAEHVRRLVEQATLADLRAIVTGLMLDTSTTGSAPCTACGRPADPPTPGPRRRPGTDRTAGPRRGASAATQARNHALERASARAWLHRREPGHLVQVAEYQNSLHLLRIDSFGMPVRRARWLTTTAARLTAGFEPYRPCRWTLDCLQQATTVIHHTAHADRDCGTALGDVDVCETHAAEHHRWRSDNRGRPEHNWAEEPAPECMCTDTDHTNGTVQDYCPRHGTDEHRGTELPPALLAGPLIAALPGPGADR